MSELAPNTCTAFGGVKRICSGTLSAVALQAKAVFDRGETAPVLIFDDATANLIDVDYRGSRDDVLKRLLHELPQQARAEPEAVRGPGRPRLGVVAREVTLLPRHWQWLSSQPGGASVALRKLVDEARRTNIEKDRVRQSQEAAYRFMSAMAGDAPGFEEAARALFAGDEHRFEQCVGVWPEDVRDHAKRLAKEALRNQSGA
jgi:uncharacterized protein